MVNFGYPYNDIVICKDSTDYLHNFLLATETTMFHFYLIAMFVLCGECHVYIKDDRLDSKKKFGILSENIIFHE